MNGIEAEKIVEVLQSDDKTSTRIIFLQDGNPFYFELSTEQLAAALPLLNKAAAGAQTGREVTAITVSEIEAWADIQGELLLTLCNTAGARLTFGLSKPLTKKLGDLVDEALQPPPDAKSQH
jgi:hypothetical protein